MFTRPKPGETEEDILKQQEEFFKKKAESKIQASAKFVSVQKDEIKPTSSCTVSDESTVCSAEVKDVLPERVVVGDIVERKTDFSLPVSNDTVRFSQGFPQAKRRQGTVGFSKSGSIFSQQNKKPRQQNPIKRFSEPMQIDPHPVASISEFTPMKKLKERIMNVPSQSFIVSGKDSKEIHSENIDKLKEMTEEEIIEEQKTLLDNLDPEIIKFLKSRRKDDKISTIAEEIEEKHIKEEVVEVEKIDTAREIIGKSEKWLHFENVETEKFQWMKNIEIPKKPKDDDSYEARFDFAGWLLPYIEPDISEKTRTLYHHGEDPGRPGYSLQELFKLCRSSVQQQRILAMNTIANILSIHSTGLYDNVIDIPIEQIFFLIRISVDDNTPTVLNAALKTLRNIFWNQMDEVCLDTLLGFGLGMFQPALTVEKDDTSGEDEKEINDQQMAELDMVKCLIRTDILIRIRYIINTVRPSTETVVYCLELLIRIMRDSQQVYTEVYECEVLFKSVIQHFIPKVYQPSSVSTTAYDVPQILAIKLCRIAATRSRRIAKDLVEKYNILDPICSYISNDIAVDTNGVKLQTESMNFLAVLIRYELGLDCFREVQPHLMRIIDYHLRNTNIDEKTTYIVQSHFSSAVGIISQLSTVKMDAVIPFIPLLLQCAAKYCAQVSSLIDFKCGNLQSISALLICITNVARSNYCVDTGLVGNYVVSLINSPAFTKITMNVKLGSNLLCEYDVHKSSPNLLILESAVWKTSEHVIPCLHSKSCLPFLAAVSSVVTSLDKNVKLKFIQHPNVEKYLKIIQNTKKFNLISNWFTKIETLFLMNTFKIVIDISGLLHNCSFYYELAVKCLGVFGVEHRKNIDYVLQNVVFNRHFYPGEMLLNEMKIEESKDVLENSVNCLNEIYTCYSQIMGLQMETGLFVDSLTLDVRIGNIVPIDWIYSPIVIQYANHQDDTKNVNEAEKSLIITRCLQWIFLYETYFPELASFINITDRFCRLCCVFLCSNSLFLDNDVQKLLRCILQLLLRSDNLTQMNFDKEIQGLNNFQDFYTQLLEHYQGVSYGDALFANFLLVPLAQRHNMKWRKILWSEYVGVAQIITLAANQSILNVDEFLNPPETDVSLLQCYRRALVGGQLNRSPILKTVAAYHVESYIKNKKERNK